MSYNTIEEGKRIEYVGEDKDNYDKEISCNQKDVFEIFIEKIRINPPYTTIWYITPSEERKKISAKCIYPDVFNAQIGVLVCRLKAYKKEVDNLLTSLNEKSIL